MPKPSELERTSTLVADDVPSVSPLTTPVTVPVPLPFDVFVNEKLKSKVAADAVDAKSVSETATTVAAIEEQTRCNIDTPSVICAFMSKLRHATRVFYSLATTLNLNPFSVG